MQPAPKRVQLPETVLASMRNTNELFNSEVVGKRNVGALDRIYTLNARILPPGAPMIEGREQIKAFWNQAIAAMGLTQAKLTIVDAEQAGDGVIEIGRADLILADGQSATVKYVVHWKQEDGAWKWNTDIWNQNQ
jgi:ketosteroid isomerase-like protein